MLTLTLTLKTGSPQTLQARMTTCFRYIICPILAADGHGSATEWEASGAKQVPRNFEFLSNEAETISGHSLVEMLLRDEKLGMNQLPPHTLGGQLSPIKANSTTQDYTRW